MLKEGDLKVGDEVVALDTGYSNKLTIGHIYTVKDLATEDKLRNGILLHGRPSAYWQRYSSFKLVTKEFSYSIY